MSRLLDHRGEPLGQSELLDAHRKIAFYQQRIRSEIAAKYDAAQNDQDMKHWSSADTSDPDNAANSQVRATLRKRSRFEVVENNPYLKGCVVSLANDFVGSGPKLSITDKRIRDNQTEEIEAEFEAWAEAIRLRQKLWRSKMAKVHDGEVFWFAYTDQRLLDYDSPVGLNFMLNEPEFVETPYETYKDGQLDNIDGIRIDAYRNPLEYFRLYNHPGGNALGNIFSPKNQESGTWISEKRTLHWFRQDRGWLRGIPEIAASLPLCAMLRRYTLAVVRGKELHASFGGLLETEGPANRSGWGETEDDPFESFPIEHGMFTTLPYGYKMKQFEGVPAGDLYDAFVNALLREIIRPILVPFNIAAGTSKESNMSSAVVDAHIYTSGQKQERCDCEEIILRKLFWMWWQEYRLTNTKYLKVRTPPKITWRWDLVTIQHTDPQKVWNAVATAHEKGFITDQDIQEVYFNRSVGEWQKLLTESVAFRKTVDLPIVEKLPEPVAPGGNKNQKSQPKAKKTTK